MQQERSTARIVVLAEGEYEVPVSQDNPTTLSELLADLGISNRNGQFYMNGAPVQGNPVVTPGSETLVMPHIRGG
jgi:hypothetical protein